METICKDFGQRRTKKKIYDSPSQTLIVHKDVVQTTNGYLHYFFSSEEPSRLSTDTLVIQMVRV